MKKSVIFFSLVLIVFFLTIIGRVYYLIEYKGDYYSKLLKEKTEIYVYGASAPRGRILDVNGKVLVDNIGVKTIVYNKLKGITKNEEIEIAKKLATILTIEPETNIDKLKEYYLLTNKDKVDGLITDEEYELYNNRKINNDELKNMKLSRITEEDLSIYTEEDKKAINIYELMNKGYSYDKKTILKNVNEVEYAKVCEENLKGVTGQMTWERTYPYGEVLRKLFGKVSDSIPLEEKEEYLSKGYSLTDKVGTSYLEKQYEEYLKGKKALYRVNKDNTLTIVENEEKGNDLILGIDIDVQMHVEEIIRNQILAAKARANTEYYKESYAVIGDPNTGRIIAIAGQRLLNDYKNPSWEDVSLNVVNDSYTVGSVVKGASMTLGYQNNIIDIGTKYRDSCVKLYYVPAKCSFKRLGVLDDVKALANSSNFYQFMIAIGLTGQKYTNNMKLNATEEHFNKYRDTFASYGLGTKTGIDIPDEKIGIIGKTIADDLLLNLSIGQYDTYTPIELLQYINTVSNNGNRMKLSLMDRVVDSNNNILLKNDNKIIDKVVMEQKYFDRIKEGMNQVLLNGTGKGHVDIKYNPAGKTGTSESLYDSNGDGVGDVMTISSGMVTFFPLNEPKYSMVVISPNVSHNNGKVDYKSQANRLISREISDYLMTK